MDQPAPPDHVPRRTEPAPPPRQGAPGLRPIAAFVATCATTFYAGLQMSSGFWALMRVRSIPWIGDLAPRWWQLPDAWGPAVAFSASLLAILVAHEMGHFVTAIRRGVPMSWPFFVPFMPPLGTLGAVIAMTPATREQAAPHAPSRLVEGIAAPSLLRIAAWGPFWGAFVAIPLIVLGIALSDVRPFSPGDGMQLGVCALFWLLERVFWPAIPPGHDIFLHPIAFAGWAGCIVTSLNLLPFGQLDGGHIAYASLGERWNTIAPTAFLLLAALVLVSPALVVFALLVRFVVGVRHPPMTRGTVAASPADRRIALAAAALFLLTFTPRPYPVSWLDVFGLR